MLCVLDNCTDPYRNLAAEEYLLDCCKEPLFRLWRNSDSVIIGRHQNAYAETDIEFIRRNRIAVVRRMTGGGAVFHDLGNINWSFFNLDSGKAVDIVISALRKMGLNAASSGRNDILLGGCKISGTAALKSNGRSLEHGTLLFKSSIEKLSGALKPRPEKFEGKAVDSVRSRVTNICEFTPLSIEDFFSSFFEAVSQGAKPFSYSEDDLKKIEQLKQEKYATDEWNFGRNPDCTFSRVRKFPSGLMESYVTINKGRISRLEIFGDYFSDIPTAEFCRIMEGCPHTPEKAIDRLRSVAVDEFFGSISSDELLELLF